MASVGVVVTTAFNVQYIDRTEFIIINNCSYPGGIPVIHFAPCHRHIISAS